MSPEALCDQGDDARARREGAGVPKSVSLAPLVSLVKFYRTADCPPMQLLAHLASHPGPFQAQAQQHVRRDATQRAQRGSGAESVQMEELKPSLRPPTLTPHLRAILKENRIPEELVMRNYFLFMNCLDFYNAILEDRVAKKPSNKKKAQKQQQQRGRQRQDAVEELPSWARSRPELFEVCAQDPKQLFTQRLEIGRGCESRD